MSAYTASRPSGGAKKSDADFFDMIDDRMRVGFKQYRTMKQCQVTKERSFKKASPNEMVAIESVLAALTVDVSTFSDTSGYSQGGLSPQETVESQRGPASSSHNHSQLTMWQQTGHRGSAGSSHGHSQLTMWQRTGHGTPTDKVFLPQPKSCLLYTSPSPRDKRQSRMPSSA